MPTIFSLDYLGVYLGLIKCLILAVVPSVNILFHALLLSLHYSRGYLELLKVLIAAAVPSVSLGSHSLLLPFHYLGRALLQVWSFLLVWDPCLSTSFGLPLRVFRIVNVLKCRFDPFSFLRSHALQLLLPYPRGYLGQFLCSVTTGVPFLVYDLIPCCPPSLCITTEGT